MMNKIIFIPTAIIVLLAMLFWGTSAVAVQGQGAGGTQTQAGIHEPGTGLINAESDTSIDQDQDRLREQDRIQDPTTHDGDEPDQDRDRIRDQDRLNATSSTSTEDDLLIMPMVQNRVQNREELREQIETRAKELDDELDALPEKERVMSQNQNQVRVAVEALLASEDILGGIGPQVSQIAQNIGSTTAQMVQAEKTIQTRSRIARFFFGGDKDTATFLKQNTERNREEVRQLNQIMADCSCDAQVKTMLQEQIENMEQEQNRLNTLADEELSKRGVFGWLFGWLK